MKPLEAKSNKPGCSVIILAAGQGKRIGGNSPKPLLPICGFPILHHIVSTIEKTEADHVLIVHRAGMVDDFKKALPQNTRLNVQWVEQKETLGTAHALNQALPFVTTDRVVVLLGDTPFVPHDIIDKICNMRNPLTVVSAEVKSPRGFGRVIRDKSGSIVNIVEEKDLQADQRKIQEVNTGVMAATTSMLTTYLPQINNINSSQEYYLTAIIPLVQNHEPGSIACVSVQPSWKVLGANTREELISLERNYTRMITDQHISNGVHIKDPSRFDCRGKLTCGQNVTIDINVIIEGNVVIGNNCSIGAGCILQNVILQDDVSVHPYSCIQNSKLDKGASVGPYAFCRDNTHIQEKGQIGCFVETKSTQIGRNSKAKHLSYLGNLTIHDDCNIGAGVIHCNYDGIKKHTSVIKDHCFVGADSQIIGPITINENSTIAAGTTLTKNVSANSLGISRQQQKNIPGWKKKSKTNID